MSNIYSAIQHKYPRLIGTSEMAPHNVRFLIGCSDATSIVGTCSLSETILQFFKELLPNVIDGKIGEHYSDIVDHSLEKVILYMGHSLRCRIQQMRIKEIKNMSTGNTAVMIIDYMMK